MMPIPIVHVITGLGTGGAEMMLTKTVLALEHLGFRNHVAALVSGGALAERLRAAGVPVTELGLRLEARRSFEAFIGLVRLLRRERPQVVQTWLYHADLLGTVAARVARVPRLAWNLRCSDMDLRHYGRMTRLVLRCLAWLSPLPDLIISNSHAGLEVHRRLGYRPRRSEVVPNGFDFDRFQPDASVRAAVRRELGLPESAPIIINVARVDPMKDHPTLLAAFAKVRAVRGDARLLLVGRRTERLPSVSGVIALGERTDVERLLAAADAFSLNSKFGEGFPNALGEAMACGLPCVVSDVGDCAAIVGDSGRVVAPGDPEALATALLALLSPAGRDLGLRARDRAAANFQMPAIAARYAAIYRSLAAGAP
jgi:glycosyltransferase involved in cell wall biosynthesis